ncbi:MAG: TolC family protein [Methylovulum sp.]|jgi:adhesin transport system outer membrane protein
MFSIIQRLVVLLILASFSCLAWAETIDKNKITLNALLLPLLSSHVRIQKAQDEVDAEVRRIQVAWGGWYPDLDMSVTMGNEQHSSVATQDYFGSANVKLNQLLWDFGATNNGIEKSRLKLLVAELDLQKVKQTFILDAASAYINLLRAHQALDFTKQSETNIRNQTGLEETRVAKGAGYSTDVLQAKTQLAAAIARRLRNEQALVEAQNSFKEFFGYLPEDFSKMEPVTLKSIDQLPNNLNTLMAIALSNNLDIRSDQIKLALSKNDVESERYTRFYPKVNLILEELLHQNQRGTATLGQTQDFVSRVEIKMPFNLGFIAYDSVKAAELAESAKHNALYDTQIIVERKNRDAFQKLQTARLTAQSLQEQADIAEAFLELARVERQLGNRSLIDILSGEVSLINARSDAISAQYDAILAILSLVEVMGALSPDIFTESQFVLPNKADTVR